jgi:hypothetical protein
LHDLPPKKSSLQKSWAFEFLNLTLQNREAVGNGLTPWAELRSARQNFPEKSFSLIAESLLNKARTYFSKNLSLNLISRAERFVV